MIAMKRLTWALVLSMTTATFLVIACGETDYTAGVYDKRYGQPESLRSATPPGPFGGAAAGEGGTSDPTKVCSGAGPIDGGPCTVSFKTTLLPLFIQNCGSPSCHGVPAGAKPQMDPANPNTTYANFVAQQAITGKPYVNPCTLDKTASSIVCNMAMAPCGTGMPLPAPGSFATQAISTQTDTWLACGAPNN